MESPHLATIAEHPTNYDDEVADELLEDFSPDEREEGNNGEEDEGNQKMSNGGVYGNFLVQHLRDGVDNKVEEMEWLSPDDHEERNMAKKRTRRCRRKTLPRKVKALLANADGRTCF